ncbi:MAG: hypothetical protein IPM13_16830 [Phycisphaerales bacterium]|nr:hypothetical protein [Phycisphaerales bacterium]
MTVAPLMVPLLMSEFSRTSPFTTPPTLMRTRFALTVPVTVTFCPTTASSSPARTGPGLASITATAPFTVEVSVLCSFSQTLLSATTASLGQSPVTQVGSTVTGKVKPAVSSLATRTGSLPEVSRRTWRARFLPVASIAKAGSVRRRTRPEASRTTTVPEASRSLPLVRMR